jgi:WD40 repeat protein
MGDRMAGSVNSVALGVVGGRKVAVSAGDDRTVRIWDLATRRPYGNGLTGPAEGSEPSP